MAFGEEKMLPLGKTMTQRTGDWIYTLEVVGYKNKHNVWAEKSKKYSPAQHVRTNDLVHAMKESDDWDHAMNLAKRIYKNK